MKYRVTKKQVEMLANGQRLKMGRRMVCADDEIREAFQYVIDHDTYDLFNIFISDSGELEVIRK